MGTNGLSRFHGTLGHDRHMKRTVVWLTKQQIKALAEMSHKSLAPVSALVRQAVKEFLERHAKRRQTP
jgi:metal-responsive CopG/Arc/MetJ family transcriptional regulator